MNTEPGVCYVCKRQGYTELHHVVFGSGMRAVSDKLGLTVYLCYEHHRGNRGVHGKDGNTLNRRLKLEAQERFEELYSHDEWMKRIGRNYT